MIRLAPVGLVQALRFQSVCSATSSTTYMQVKRNMQIKREHIVNVPNALSASRILAAPLIASAVLNAQYELALGGLVYCGLSDFVPGLC